MEGCRSNSNQEWTIPKEKGMKKVLVLTAVLCFVASMSHASVLESWLTVDNATPNVGQTFTVSIWLQVVPDPSLTLKLGHLEDISQGGIESAAVSIYQTGPAGRYSAVQAANVPPTQLKVVKTTFNTSVWDQQHVPAARTDTTDGIYDANGTYIGGNGDFDALQAAGATSGGDLTIGTTGPVLLATETWTCLVKGQASLHITMPYSTYQGPNVQPGFTIGQLAPSGRHWDLNDTTGSGTYKNYFTNYTIGSLDGGGHLVGGQDLVLNPVPEPATLALLGFGAVATMLRRRNKK
jgi:hypothetical protein